MIIQLLAFDMCNKYLMQFNSLCQVLTQLQFYIMCLRFCQINNAGPP